MPRICLTSIAAAVALSLSAPLTAEARTPCANEEAPPTALNSAQVSDAVFCLTNQVRAHYGLPAFRRDARLDATARLYSTDMSARGFFGHTSPEGLSPSDRGIAQGYTIGVGENIASGYAHAQEVVLAWVASAPHCRNVLSAAVDLGVGTKGGLDPYYTQNFGDYYSRPVNETARGACPHTVDLDALTIAPPAVVTEPVGATPQPREQPTGRGTTATAKPTLSALSLSSRRLRTGRRGTTISFKLSTPATVTLRIQRATGRGSRYRTMAGGLADRQGVQGTNTVRFNGSLGGRKLRPGRYRLQVFATDAADRESAVSRIRFAVVRR